MMTICPKCGQHYDVDQDYVGCTVDCEICGSQFEVKQPSCVPMSADISSQAQEQNAMSKIPAQSFDAAQMHGGTASMSSPPHRSSMKPLVCEMCGSSDLMKTDGVFVCQSCGTKYSVEEAKKMMISGTVNVAGTVKIDKSEELENLYKLARRARETNDFSQAAKYYDLILQKGDSDSWEAYFYSDYCRIQQIDIKSWEVMANYKNKLTTVVGLVANISNLSSRRNVYDEIALKVRNLALVLEETVKKYYIRLAGEQQGPDKGFWDALFDFIFDLKLGGDFVLASEMDSKFKSLVALCCSLGNSLRERYERGDKAVQVTTFTDCWITGVTIYNKFSGGKEPRRINEEILRYRKDYVAPESYGLKKFKTIITRIIVGSIVFVIVVYLFIWLLICLLD